MKQRKQRMMENKPCLVKYFWQVTYAHTIAYFLAGIFAAVAMNYKELFTTEVYAVLMRPIDHPVVALGMGLQVFRGVIIALVILPLRKVFFEEKHGLLKLGLIVFGFAVLTTFAAAPGSFEGYIFTNISPVLQLFGYPEAILYVSLFIGILFVSIKYERKKIVTILPIIFVALIVLMSIMGYLAAIGVIDTQMR
jgi:hypothetical protein